MLEALKQHCRGTIYQVGDPGFEETANGWNLAVRQNPAIVVDAETIEDVQYAVRHARESGLKIQVMATGHGLPRACHGNLLIRISKLDHVVVDASECSVKVGGGAVFSRLLDAAQEEGLTALCGSSRTVGVVGYLLGGGYGLLSRKYGLAVDGLRKMSIVKADGSLVHASSSENTDLFWAMTGGGGTFGIVVEAELDLFPHAKVYGGTIIYAAGLAKEVLMRFAEWSENAPEEAMAAVGLYNFPPLPFIPEVVRGKAVVIVNMCAALDESDAERCFQPLRSAGPVIADTCCELASNEVNRVFNDPESPTTGLATGALLSDFTAESIDALLEAVGQVEKMPLLKFDIRLLGGAQNRTETQTAMSGARDAKFLFSTVGIPNPHASPEDIRTFAHSLTTSLDCHSRIPLTFLGEGTVTHSAVRAAIGDHYDRMVGIKNEHDPDNLFSFAGIGLSD